MKKLCKILPIALILCFLVGCQDKVALAELDEFRAQAAVEEQNKALVLKWSEEQDKGNLDIFLEIFAPDFLYYTPSSNPKPMSKSTIYDFFAFLT